MLYTIYKSHTYSYKYLSFKAPLTCDAYGHDTSTSVFDITIYTKDTYTYMYMLCESVFYSYYNFYSIFHKFILISHVLFVRIFVLYALAYKTYRCIHLLLYSRISAHWSNNLDLPRNFYRSREACETPCSTYVPLCLSYS